MTIHSKGKMDIKSVGSEKRANKRLNASLPILLPTGKTHTKNISAGGVYFEMETSDAEPYTVGQNIPIWIHANYGSDTHLAQQLWLFVTATVVRKEKTACATQSHKQGVALMYIGKLDSMLSTVSGFY